MADTIVLRRAFSVSADDDGTTGTATILSTFTCPNPFVPGSDAVVYRPVTIAVTFPLDLDTVRSDIADAHPGASSVTWGTA